MSVQTASYIVAAVILACTLIAALATGAVLFSGVLS